MKVFLKTCDLGIADVGSVQERQEIQNAKLFMSARGDNTVG